MSAQPTVSLMASGPVAAALLALLAAAAPAQIQPLNPLNPGGQQPQGPASQNPTGQNPTGQNPGGINQAGQPNVNLPGTFLSPQNPFGNGSQGPDEFSSIWSAPSAPQWSGFPAFPARLQGYGNYPLPADPDDPNATGLVAPLPAAEPEPVGWPSWVRLRARKPLPFATDVGLLIAQDGRSWFRETPDEPFVPSMQHDKFASLPVGAEAEQRGRGTFEVLLHQSTRIEAAGRTRLRVVGLDEQNVSLAFADLSWLRVHVTGRTNKVRLPDGSELEIAPAEVPAEMQGALSGFGALFGTASIPEVARPALVEVERVDEPSWYGGRATITNLGSRSVRWRHAFGETTIEPSQRVTFFLTPPAAPTLAGLQPGDARVEDDGDATVCRAVSNTEVQWCGASIAVPAGGAVRIESLSGPVRRSDGVGGDAAETATGG